MPVLYTTCEYKYASGCSIKCDVYPAQRGAPVAVCIHGGALMMGSRRGGFPQLDMDMLRKEGYWLVSIDYRLAPETKLEYIIEDVRDALDWVREEGAETFGYDATKMIVMGISAGGYLALMTGTFERKPNVIVSVYGYCDILEEWYCKPSPFYCRQPLVDREDAMKNGIHDYELSEGYVKNRGSLYLYTRQTGTWTSLVSGYDIAADRAKIEKFCSVYNIADHYPPTMLLHGNNDTDVPYEQSVIMYNALKARGLTAELVTYEGGGHAFDFNIEDPKSAELIGRAMRFIKEQVRK